MILEATIAVFYVLVCLYATLRIAYRTSILRSHTRKQKLKRWSMILLMLFGAIMSVLFLVEIIFYFIDPNLFEVL